MTDSPETATEADGETPRAAALNILPVGTKCVRYIGSYGAGTLKGFVVQIPDGRKIASAGSAAEAWRKAEQWGKRQPT